MSRYTLDRVLPARPEDQKEERVAVSNGLEFTWSAEEVTEFLNREENRGLTWHVTTRQNTLTCPQCHGSGQLQLGMKFDMHIVDDCPTCNRRGWIVDRRRYGQGNRRRESVVRISEL